VAIIGKSSAIVVKVGEENKRTGVSSHLEKGGRRPGENVGNWDERLEGGRINERPIK
jgi:hypothetical protein